MQVFDEKTNKVVELLITNEMYHEYCFEPPFDKYYGFAIRTYQKTFIDGKIYWAILHDVFELTTA
jgi:hypothetical protein